MDEIISIGLGEYRVSTRTNEILVAYGLGSCVAIGIVDPGLGLGGLLHAVLPYNNEQSSQNPKFVDTGIRVLLQNMLQLGANRHRLLVHLAGGASVLAISGYTQLFNIGSRNIAAALACLCEERLPITSKDVGGGNGRTVRLYLRNGRMTVQALGQEEKIL